VKDADGKVIGVVTLRIKGQAIASILEASRGEAGRVPMLIDGDGIIIHHPDSGTSTRAWCRSTRRRSRRSWPTSASAGRRSRR
jgi:hypothetical protein